MAKIDLFSCDRCKKEFRLLNGSTIYIDGERSPDAAGGMDTDQHSADLCNLCQANLLGQLLSSLDVKNRIKIFKIFGGK